MFRLMRMLLIGAFVLASVFACSSIGVKPWQREHLSKPSMQLEGNALDTAVNEHIYFSKEASTGGRGFGGGGCGCN